MGALPEASNQKDTVILTVEDNKSDDESTRLNELSFPWPLINFIIDSKEVIYLSKPKLIKHLLLSYRLRLFVVFITCIFCIEYGSIVRGKNPEQRMLCVFFIDQGACGLFVVLVHTCAILFHWTPSTLARFSSNKQHAIQFFIGFAHMVTVFSIIWFFIVHIWFIRRIWFIGGFEALYNDWYYDDDKTMIIFTIMFIIQDIVGIWLLYGWIWNNSRVLCQCGQKTQPCPDKLPNNYDYLDRKETTTCEKIGGNNTYIDRDLMLV